MILYGQVSVACWTNIRDLLTMVVKKEFIMFCEHCQIERGSDKSYCKYCGERLQRHSTRTLPPTYDIIDEPSYPRREGRLSNANRTRRSELIVPNFQQFEDYVPDTSEIGNADLWRAFKVASHPDALPFVGCFLLLAVIGLCSILNTCSAIF